jgi:hypothetical protein
MRRANRELRSAIAVQCRDAGAVVRAVTIDSVNIEVAIGRGGATPRVVGERDADGVAAGAEIPGEGQVLPCA